MLSTQEHILKSTYILQSSHHEPFKWTLFRGDGGARMYIKSIIKSVIGMFVMAEQS